MWRIDFTSHMVYYKEGIMREDEKRNIFMRRYWYMDSIAAISKRYGLSQSKVKSLLFRIRNQLRERLDKEGYDL